MDLQDLVHGVRIKRQANRRNGVHIAPATSMLWAGLMSIMISRGIVMRPSISCTKTKSCQSASTCPILMQQLLERSDLILGTYTTAVISSVSTAAGRMMTLVISMPSMPWQNITGSISVSE